MAKVVFNMTMSLDGFVAGPNDGPENGLGEGVAALFNWYFSGDTEFRISEGTMDGVESAIRQAKQAARDKNVVVATASILQ